MIANWKFHAVALTVICTVITVIYLLFAPPPPAPPVDPNLVGDRAIEIYSATWGMECNQYIKEINEAPAKKVEGTTAAEKPKLEYATRNNALMRVGELCSGKNLCELTATNDSLKLNVMDVCGKKLEISYRCYSYDRLWNLTIGQGETKKIDCNAATPAPAK